MKALHIKTAIFTLGIIGLTTYKIHGNSSGASSPLTGAPNENTCTSCHGGSSLVTSGNQHDRIKLTGNFTGGGYIPDSIYNLTLTYAESGKSTFGFQMTSLVNGQAAGRFTSSSRTNTFSATVNGSTRYYIEHNSTGSAGVATDSTAWTFQWRAPSSNQGEITFYVALNSTNNNGSSSGDVIYNKTFKIEPSSLLPKATAKASSTILCAGKSISLEGNSTNNATTYEWSFPNGSPTSSTSQNPNVLYAASGNQIAILRTFNAKGASQPDTLKLNILDAAVKPALNIKTATTVLCLGDSIDFSLTQAVRHTYNWSNGATGRNTKIDSGGWVYVLANRDNGCSTVSDSVFVVAFPKPSFTVGYGIFTDSVCTKEPLLILLNNKSFADSYSNVGPQGPFSTDSFIIKTIQTGANDFQFWAKSKIGCVSPASDKTTFMGIDTPSAPVLKVAETLLDSIKFEWNPHVYAESYQYSVDGGKNWNAPTSGLTSTYQWIPLDSATQTLDFMVRAKTGVLCGFSNVAQIQAKGAGCTIPKWNVITKQSHVCLDSQFSLGIEGLWSLNSYQLKINGDVISDSIFTETITKSKNYHIQLLDSQQLICGYFDKNIFINVDSVIQISASFNPNENYIFCGVNEKETIELELYNYQNNYTYFAKTIDSTYLLAKKTDIALLPKSYTLALEGYSAYNCKTQEYSFKLFVDTIADASFEIEWVNDWQYKLTSNSDTQKYQHFWKNATNNQTLSESNVSELVFDFVDFSNDEINIEHYLISSATDFEAFCTYESSKKLLVKNLSTKNQSLENIPKLMPNPVKNLSRLQCYQCPIETTVSIFTNLGGFVGKWPYNEINGLTLSTGMYYCEIETATGRYQQKLIISCD